MEKLLSTSYAPLQPPYQIITYNGKAGMQIGTLIVTTQKEGDNYAIETHSHPVVAYANKQNEMARPKVMNRTIMEGAVWNHVELRDVKTICYSDENSISWDYFKRCLMDNIHWAFRRNVIQAADFRLFWDLRRIGIRVELPEPGEYTITLKRIYPYGENGSRVIQSQINDHLLLNASWESDNMAIDMIKGQLEGYSGIMGGSIHEPSPYRIRFITDNDELKNICDELNQCV